MCKAESPSCNKNTLFRSRRESQTSRRKTGSGVRNRQSTGRGVSVRSARRVLCLWRRKPWIRPDLAIWARLGLTDRVDSASTVTYLDNTQEISVVSWVTAFSVPTQQRRRFAHSSSAWKIWGFFVSFFSFCFVLDYTNRKGSIKETKGISIILILRCSQNTMGVPLSSLLLPGISQ